MAYCPRSTGLLPAGPPALVEGLSLPLPGDAGKRRRADATWSTRPDRRPSRPRPRGPLGPGPEAYASFCCGVPLLRWGWLCYEEASRRSLSVRVFSPPQHGGASPVRWRGCPQCGQDGLRFFASGLGASHTRRKSSATALGNALLRKDLWRFGVFPPERWQAAASRPHELGFINH